MANLTFQIDDNKVEEVITTMRALVINEDIIE